MKKIFLILSSIALAVSCIEDSRENFMVDDTLSLVYDEVVVPVSVYSGSATVTVLKAGKGTQAANVTLGVSPEALAAYNLENGTSYTALGSGSYSFPGQTVSIKAEQATKSVRIEWDPSALYPALDGANSVIPVVITEGSLEINQKRNLVLLNILNSQVGFASSGSSTVAGEEASKDGAVSLKITVDNPLSKDLKLTIIPDNSLVPTYNTVNGTSYIQAPGGYVQMPSEDIVLKAGESDCFCDVTLKNSALFSGNSMMSFSRMVVPFRISATDEAGVGILDKIYYLVVKSPYAAASVSRVWGKYSTETPWTDAYGLPNGGDRNLTVDQNWVYLPWAVGGTTARITAISITDPSNTMLVNCTGFWDNVITTACVRMIDKGDGTLMLTATGANADKFAFYSWENGIDKAPRVDTLQCTWRRGGDRFEFHGTWADGVVYTHAYQGTFSTRYEVKNGKFVKKDRTLVNVPFTGFGGEYKYPGQDQLLFASSDTSIFMTPTGTTYKQGDGQDTHDMSFEKCGAGKLTFGYRVFSFKDDDFIAFTAMDLDDDLDTDGITPIPSKRRAKLVIVKDKGGFKASLNPDEMEIVYEAPLQGENKTDIAIAEPMALQGDCAVCVLPDKVYIAAGFQGIGLSLFKME